ncbi:MAG: FtsQ-type POTRA domain-containing protein [Bacilli bacterium]|jgi:cell division septal protein FtsQ|nr:FtsQ-type POTRA domain-containing protein [Bacilli bacterium]
MANVKRVKRRRINFKAVILLLLIVYLIVMLLYTFFTMPIKNIYIKNTTLLSDNDVIEVAGIKDYPSIFKLSSKKLEEKILSLELVEKVKVSKKLNGKLIIDIDEAVPLFYVRSTDKVVLSSKKHVNNNNKYLGIPALINKVPNDLLNKFIEAFKEVDLDILKMINEIEYNPNISDNVVIDDNRFLLRMNDTNIVYVNVLNMKRLNDYKEFFMLIGDNRGILYLDSYDSDNNLVGLFTSFDSQVGEDDSGRDQQD